MSDVYSHSKFAFWICKNIHVYAIKFCCDIFILMKTLLLINERPCIALVIGNYLVMNLKYPFGYVKQLVISVKCTG